MRLCEPKRRIIAQKGRPGANSSCLPSVSLLLRPAVGESIAELWPLTLGTECSAGLRVNARAFGKLPIASGGAGDSSILLSVVIWPRPLCVKAATAGHATPCSLTAFARRHQLLPLPSGLSTRSSPTRR